MSLYDVRTALESRLAALPNLPEVGWENVAFDPPDDELHLLVYMLRATTLSPTFGAVEMTREQGYLQVSVRAPENRGPRPAEQMANTIREHFPKGLGLTAGTTRVTIQQRGSVTPARSDGGWYRIDLSIPYFANVFHAT